MKSVYPVSFAFLFANINCQVNSDCDLVSFVPSQVLNVFQFSLPKSSAVVLFDKFNDVVSNKLKWEIRCQHILHAAENLNQFGLLDKYFLSSRIPSTVRTLTSNASLPNVLNKKSYKVTLTVAQNQKSAATKSTMDFSTEVYDPLLDPIWRHMSVAVSYFDRIYFFKDLTTKTGFIGANLETWDLLGQKLNLKFSYITGAGYRGAYGLLATRKADLVIPGGFMSARTNAIADQSPYIYLEIFKFYNAKPRPMPAYLSLIRPFDFWVWFWMLVAGGFASLAFYLMNYKVKLNKFNIIQLLLSSIISEALSGQKWIRLHQNWYGYVILLMWLMYGLLMSASYSSNLLAHLTVVERTKPDNTFEDLVKNKRTLGAPIGTLIGQWLKTSPREIVRRAEKECVEERGGYYFPNFTTTSLTPPTITPLLETGEASSIFAISGFGRLEHKYRLGTDTLIETYMTFDMLKRHPLKPQVDLLMGRFHAMGILLHAQERGMWRNAAISREYRRNKKDQDEDGERQPLSIEHLLTLWIKTSVLISISCLTFISEMIRKVMLRSSTRRLNYDED